MGRLDLVLPADFALLVPLDLGDDSGREVGQDGCLRAVFRFLRDDKATVLLVGASVTPGGDS